MFRGVSQRIHFTFLVLALTCQLCGAAAPANFGAAKKVAAELFNRHPVTLYCGCSYYQGKDIDLTSCNMHSAIPIARAHRIEWEHMMPAEHFGRTHRCWTEKICKNKKNNKTYRGRKCCKKIDPSFQQQEAELYNLWPAVGAVNQARSNYRYGILHNKRGFYGCEFERDNQFQIAEPPDRAKGIVARANLFMAARYKLVLSKEQQELFQQWHQQFPPDAWELQWGREVARIVGYENSYITGTSL